MDTRSGTTEFLMGIPLFADVLSPAQIKELAADSHPAFFRNDTLLMSQGDLGSSMFVLVEGDVSVNLLDPNGHGRRVAMLGPGEVVGEMSLFTGDRRTATVTAATNVRAIEITRASLERLFARSPDLLERFAAILASRQAELKAIVGQDAGRAREDFRRKARLFFAELFHRPGASA